ncbi:MAG TPA: GGDEF domain-containing protein [Longimicrobiales bacterium]
MMRSRALLLPLPGAALVAGGAAALTFAAQTPPLEQAARGLPIPALVVAALLAWRFRNARLFAATVVIAVAFVVLHARWLGASGLAQTVIVTFLPVGLVLLALKRDRGFTLRELRGSVIAAVAPATVAAFLSAGRSDAALRWLTHAYIHPAYTDWSALPQIALFVIVVSLLVVALRALRRLNAGEAALFWVIIAAACAFVAPPDSTARGVWVVTSALVVIVALVEIAYAFAFTDELTGLPGRRAFNYTISSLQPPYAIAVVDVDHFKTFNDTHGHEVGDQVLRMVAARLSRVGGGGVAYRSGGEEFTIIFEGANKRHAGEHAEAVRAAIADASFALRRTPRPRDKRGKEKRGRSGAARDVLRVTVSVGVAGATDRSKTVHAVIEAADQAMYRAKTAGRNRVVA